MTPGVPLPLPQVVYRVVEESLLPARVNDTTAQSYGFNDGAIWDYGAGVEGDGRYLRWIRQSFPLEFTLPNSTRSLPPRSAADDAETTEPMEGDLAKQVEYDMDEQGSQIPSFPFSPSTHSIRSRSSLDRRDQS